MEKRQVRVSLYGIIHPAHLIEFQPALTWAKSHFQLGYEVRDQARAPWRRDALGFLYFAYPPGKPRLGGEVKLRVASSEDPRSLENGRDLLLPTSQRWSRPLHPIATNPLQRPLYNKLLDEVLLS